jgi:anthranilate synthase component 2
MKITEIEKLDLSHIILSPGPGKPQDAGICEDVIRHFSGKIPIFGVCLGHQAICEVFGMTVTYAKNLMHGKQSDIILDTSCPVFNELPETIKAARYHSLAAKEDTLPECLTVTAKTADGEIMGVKHRNFDVFGVQFHPESILTPLGGKIINSFLKGAK